MKKPIFDFLTYIGFILIGYILIGIVSIIFMHVFNVDLLAFESGTINLNQLNTIKLYQGLASILLFAFPSVLFIYFYNKKYNFYTDIQTIQPNIILIAIALLLAFSPFMFFSAEWNQKMQLPNMFSSLELLMRTMEDKAAALTEQFLTMNHWYDVLINVIIIGIIPGISEELMFRGCFQNIFYKMSNNKHIAIWLAAILFSAIHFQFFGFVPRMLLGAIFGYVYVSTRSIWVPIAMHVFNNAFQVIMAYYNPEIIGKSDKDIPHIAWYVAFISFFLSLYFYRKIKQQKAISNITA